MPFFWLVAGVSKASVETDIHIAPDLRLTADAVAVVSDLSDLTELAITVRENGALSAHLST